MTPGYDTQARYLAQHVSALEAAGYEVSVYNIDAPPLKGGSPSTYIQPAIKYPTYIGVLSHFDAVNWYSGDDFAPQDLDQTSPRRPTSATAQTGSLEMSSWSHKLMLEMRDYANEGGKLVVDGRNIHQAYTSTSASLSATGPYTWTPDKLFGFFYPPNNSGDDDYPGTAYQRSRTISNDTWQNYLGVVGRQAGVGVTGTKFDTAPVTPKAGSIFEGMDALHGRRDRGQRPDAERGRHGAPAGQVPAAPAQLEQHLHPGAAAPGDGAGRLHHDARPDGQRWRDPLDA